MKDDIMGILNEVEDVAVELHDRAGNDFDKSLAVRLDHVVVELEKLYRKQADHEGVTLWNQDYQHNTKEKYIWVST